MLLAAVLLPILLAAASFNGEEAFAEVDTDGDGCVTWAEHTAAQAKDPDKFKGDEATFHKLDADGSNCISLQELDAVYA